MSVNQYATLQDYKNYVTARGSSMSTDATDDDTIRHLLENASRFLDAKTGRRFYPSIETHYYDIPSTRELRFDTEVLSVIAVTNGDGTSIASTEYNLLDKNFTPYWGLKLKETSAVTWQADTNGNSEAVISVQSWNGYRQYFSQLGWVSDGTLAAAITDTTTLSFTMNTGHGLVRDQIIKIDSEIMNINNVSTNTITPHARGENGSTAATHLNGTTVYIWNPQEDAFASVLEIAHQAYARRLGQSNSMDSQITAAGIVLSPRDIPAMAEEFIRVYRRWV